MPQALDTYNKLARLPFGKWLFSRGLCLRAPYFATIAPRVEDYRPGRMVCRIADRRRVHNHIGTVHAIALCNLAELCGALTLDSVMPPHLRWIPQGMTVKYLRKASGTMTGTAELAPEAVREGSVVVPIRVTDPQGQVVFEAHIDFYVSPNKKS